MELSPHELPKTSPLSRLHFRAREARILSDKAALQQSGLEQEIAEISGKLSYATLETMQPSEYALLAARRVLLENSLESVKREVERHSSDARASRENFEAEHAAYGRLFSEMAALDSYTGSSQREALQARAESMTRA